MPSFLRPPRRVRPPTLSLRGRRDEAGFTLIELLVVMVIIAILTAIAVPVFLTQRQKARDTTVRADLRAISQEVSAYGVEKATYPTARTLNAAGITLRTSPTVSASVVWSSATNCCLAATSSASGRDTSGYAQHVGLTTRFFTRDAAGTVTLVTAANTGCLNTMSPSAANGYWTSDGYHDESFQN